MHIDDIVYMREIFIVQPYLVGSKKSKSLALIIPAEVVKQYQIDTSTAFALKANAETNLITLQQTKYLETEDQKYLKPTEQPFHGSTQKAGRIQ
jgi:antitoxin component of MazEF toxin-antitoxin module